ncbi:MAG: cytochrome c oxidase subunit 3 [Woeseiaceae bacterium]|nr:cytochrome c oxidase subunit 3 [Woeseiaceae bacterium]
MEFILVILALILATFLGWLLKQSFNTQPWVPKVESELANQAPFGANAKLVALTVLLAVITSFFALIMSAYAERMELGDWVPLTEPQLLWVNTGILALASIAFQWTRNAAVDGRRETLKPGMLVTGALTTAFLVGQFIAWSMLYANGQTITGNPANGFFYFMTGAHALHILGGMYVWARATYRLMTQEDAVPVRKSIELCTIYWHFLLVVWLVMFGLLLST